MRDEGSAVFAGRVAESPRRRIPTVDQDYAFEPRGHGRENAAVSGHFRLATANDAHVPSVDFPLETLARPLTHLARIEQRETLPLGCLENRRCQRMLRISLDACRQLQYQRTVNAFCRNAICQGRLAIRQRTGLVENDRAAAVDPLEDRRITDDDASLRCQRDGPDDRDRNGDEQRTGRGDDQHGKEPNRVAAPHPGRDGQCQRHRRVPGTELIAETTQPRTPLFRVAHDVHDAGVA